MIIQFIFGIELTELLSLETLFSVKRNNYYWLHLDSMKTVSDDVIWTLDSNIFKMLFW